jgi:Sulfotransferase family
MRVLTGSPKHSGASSVRRFTSPRIEAPIIIIGSGRSGSSLLNALLDAHPDIVMFSELNFLVPHAWKAFSEVFAPARAWNLLARFNAGHSPASPSFEFGAFLKALDDEEWVRRGAVLRRTIADLFCLYDKRATLWGFKEIWNGSAYRHDWAIYDAVFPEAQWVHIIRNPAEYLRAVAWHGRRAYSMDECAALLRGWLEVFAMSRLRERTGRYCEIRYEDMIQEPEHTLAPLFGHIGISWHEDCRRALGRQVGIKSGTIGSPAHFPTTIQEVAGLSEILDEFGYPREYAQSEATPPLESPRLAPLDGNRWQLCGEIRREEGVCWRFDLDATDQAGKLVVKSDDIDFWQRSPLRLFEDAQPLTPAHALHFWIRQRGGGAYSHWQTGLLFSTSDNSDPNLNGRIYSFDLQG